MSFVPPLSPNTDRTDDQAGGILCLSQYGTSEGKKGVGGAGGDDGGVKGDDCGVVERGIKGYNC